MVRKVEPSTSISHLESFLKNLADEILDGQSPSPSITSQNWAYLAKYYKESDFKTLENPLMRIILEIFLGTMIIWILEDNKGSRQPKIPALSKILDKAMQSGIFFDAEFEQQLKGCFKTAQDLNLDLMKIWALLPTLNLSDLLEEDLLGTMVQNLLPQKLRKSMAANYTSNISARFLAALSIREDITQVSDPFSGSGRLLTALIEESHYRNIAKPSAITLNELLDLAAYLAALRVLYFHKRKKRISKLVLHLGDAFSKIRPPLELSNGSPSYFEDVQMVIMNPPFTRYLRLSKGYLETLRYRCRNYEKYMAPQMGLHVFSLFLADAILKPGGRIAAVLPAPTFYSKYSEGLKEFLLSRYHIRIIVGTTTDKAFSEGSDLKEVMFVADKRRKGEKLTDQVRFATVNEELTYDNFRAVAQRVWEGSSTQFDINFRTVSREKLRTNWNWIKFLEHHKIHSLADVLQTNPKVRNATSLGLRIVRGFEMYGPEFFFLPNKDWKKTGETSEEVIFTHDDSGTSCSFSRSILLLALRKPSFYSESVTPDVEHYVLRVKNGQEDLIPQEYIEERQDHWQVAKNRFGVDWVQHIDRQLNSKKPFGHLFTVDKFGITTTGTIIHYSDEQITASKNFYLIDCNSKTAKLLAAWMSSTLFILLFLAARREIGGAFGRLQIVDYQEEPLFLMTSEIREEVSVGILSAFDEFRNFNLPALRDQIGWNPRKKLDLAILKALEIEGVRPHDFLESIYQTISQIFAETDSRGKKRRKRD
ncbi:MAG: Eco57I restriction-modification methylase domain-containing protein [Candidatus Hodarchaeales archaeon]